MNQFLNFLCDNWRLIAGILVLVATLLLQLLKKKPVLNEFDTILLRVFEVLPEFINRVESIGGSAEEKKALVLETVKTFVKVQFSINLPESFICLISDAIERILSTPQKKVR